MAKMTALSISNITFSDNLWKKRQQLIRESVIPYQWDTLNDNVPGVEPSHTLENFRIAAGLSNATYYGMVFQDSDLYKWLETVGYSLSMHRTEELEKKADEAIDLVAAAQEESGYIHTYHQCVRPDKKWTNLRDDHELYCAGHLMEAAVAYFDATGKTVLLNVACRFADLISDLFGPGENQMKGYPGHPEIELALLKLYKATDNIKYLNSSKFFIGERGNEPHYFEWEAAKRSDNKGTPPSYCQSHLPIREQSSIEGHAVRAVYLYTAVAELAAETGDPELVEASERVWRNMTDKRMYVTGGIGSSHYHESFSFDYDLPSDRAYTETCASVGLVFWADRMLKLTEDASYADVMERTIYNGLLSGMSLDGTKYFYVNPLEVWPEAVKTRNDLSDTELERQGWFVCACCPPNIARFISSFGDYVYAWKEDRKELQVNLYAAGDAVFSTDTENIRVRQTTEYPWGEHVSFTIDSDKGGVELTLALRVPGWCRNPELKVNGKTVDLEDVTENGYAKVHRYWQKADDVTLFLPMEVEWIRADTRVRENIGKTALQRGPMVYCLEEHDNGSELQEILVSDESPCDVTFEEGDLGGVNVITGRGYRETLHGDALYTTRRPHREPVTFKAVPYFSWANRTPGEMRVWLREAKDD
ncbi:glycoside hydrolase family 127 protein [Salibacterium lacus]|uniref:Glycoside hydrolase family 127 protein n=1 Tax=Salibacterium lacus TaxID=1898109 RepID=A0ABW5T430_9BACI